LGKLIPAGTGLERYRNIRVAPTPEAQAAAFNVTYADFDYDTVGGSAAMQFDDLDFGDALR
jgi:DNA-directed RNA polymerase subunit beta'